MFFVEFALACLKLLPNSPVTFNMVFIRNKKQQNKRLLSQLNASDMDFMIEQNNHEAKTENRSNRE